MLYIQCSEESKPRILKINATRRRCGYDQVDVEKGLSRSLCKYSSSQPMLDAPGPFRFVCRTYPISQAAHVSEHLSPISPI